MAIIYTYPVKATPNANDLILISDSQDSNKTKQVTIGSLPGGSGSGVSSVTSANAAITVADSSTTPVLTSVAYSGGTGIGHVPTGSGSSATVYLDGSGNWSTPVGTAYTAGDGLDLTGSTFSTDLKANGGLVIESTELAVDLGASSITGTLAVADGGTGAATLSGLLKGNGTGAITGGAGLNDLSNVSFTATANGSLYVGQISSAPASGLGNVTLGGGAGKIMSSGADNVLIGSDSATLLTSASDNVIVGSDSAAAITEGGSNVLIGSDVSATLTTGTNNVIIGKSANIASATLSSTTVVGQGASGAADSTVVGKGATASTNGVAIGSGATAAGGGIAIGKDASAAANEIELNGITSSIVGQVGSTNNGQLKITINGTVHYIQLLTP